MPIPQPPPPMHYQNQNPFPVYLNKPQPIPGMTNPDSLYRQVFNRDINFFLYVIEKTEPPY